MTEEEALSVVRRNPPPFATMELLRRFVVEHEQTTGVRVLRLEVNWDEGDANGPRMTLDASRTNDVQ